MLSLGMFSWFGYSLPFEARIQLIRQAGFDSTCLWLGDEEEEVKAGRQDSMPPLVRGCGLALDNAHAPYKNCNNLWDPSSKDVRKAIAECGTSILFCRNHAIPIMVMHVTEGEAPPPLSASGLTAIETIARLAERSGVVIAIENTRRFDYLDSIFSRVRSPSLRFCYDSSHDFMAGKSKGKLLEKWRNLVVTTHLSDSKQQTADDHLLPAKGTIDWVPIARCLRQSGYSGTLMLEVDGRPAFQCGLSAEEFLRTCHRWLVGFKRILEDG